MYRVATMNSDLARRAYQDITIRLTGIRHRYVLSRALFGFCLSSSVAVLLGLLLLCLEALFYMPPSAKLPLATLSGLLCLGFLVRYCLWPLLRVPSLEDVALLVESRIEGMQEVLISALQLWKQQSAGNHGYSSGLIEAAVVQAKEDITDLNMNELVERGPTIKMVTIFMVTAAITSVFLLIWPQLLSGAAGRLGHLHTAYSRPPETWIEVHPGNVQKVAGDSLEITAKISGVVPTNALLFMRETRDTNWTPAELAVRQNRVRYTVKSLTRSFFYHLQAGSAQTPPCTLVVHPRPMVKSITHTIRYPAYTGLAKRRLNPGGDIVAPEGSDVSLQIQVSQVIETAWLDIDNTQVYASTSGRAASANVTVGGNKRYTIGLRNDLGIDNRDPVEYRIIALQDRSPEVRLLRPGDDSELGEDMRVVLVAEGRDDFGIARADITYAIEGQPTEYALPLPLDQEDPREMSLTYAWNLSRMDLLPGDQISYRIRVFDTNTVSGPGVGETPSYILRFPSLYEIHQEARRAQNESISEMERLQETSSELGEKLDEVAHVLLKEDNVAWEQLKEMETALDQQKETGDALRETLEKLEQTIQRLEQSGLIEDETLQKLEEIQELLSRLETPGLKKAMQQLQDALQEVDPDAVQDALDSFRDEQAAFRQNLDRTISLLKRVQDQQSLDALVKAMEELSSEQNKVIDELEKGGSVQDLQDRERALEKDAERLHNELNIVSEQIDGSTGENLSRISTEMGEQQVPLRMQRMRQQMGAGIGQEAVDQGNNIARDLDDLTEQLREARKAYVAAQKERITQELNKMLHDLINLSQAQERTARSARDASKDADPAPLAVEQARILSGTSRLAKHLMEASRKTFFVTPQTSAFLGKALQKMDQTGGLLQGGRGTRAAKSAREAMGALNTTALAVRQAISDLASAASAIGFDEMLKKMQDLAEQQGRLNARSQDMFGQPGFSPGQSMSLSRMAAQQQAIRQAMEELRGQMDAQRQKLLGDLGDILSEMDDVSKRLSRGMLDRKTLNRQRRILSRMIDAQRSVRERGWSRQRQAKGGKDTEYRGPGSLPDHLGELDNPLRARLKEALAQGYPVEFEPLIRQYFEKLIQDALAGTEKRETP